VVAVLFAGRRALARLEGVCWSLQWSTVCCVPAIPVVCMPNAHLETISLVLRLHYANKYVFYRFRCTIGICRLSHAGAVVTAARLRVGPLPLGGAHVFRDHTA
jgi:hypothetical protein